MTENKQKTEFQLGVESERKRIMETLHRYSAEGFELIPTSQEPGVNRSLVKRISTAELVTRIWESSND